MPLNQLEVRVSANTADLSRGLRQASQEQTKFGRRTERIAKGTGRALVQSGIGGMFGRMIVGRVAMRAPGAFGSAARGAFALSRVGGPLAIATSLAGARQISKMRTMLQLMQQLGQQAAEVGRQYDNMSITQREFMTSGERTFSRMNQVFNRAANAVINRNAEVFETGARMFRGAGFSRAAGFAEMRAGASRMMGSLIRGDFASMGNAGAQIRGGALQAIGLYRGDPIQGERQRFARRAVNQRRRVTGAAERGTQAEASVIARIIETQRSGSAQQIELLQQILQTIQQNGPIVMQK